MTAPATLTELDSHCLITMDDGKANAISPAMLDALNTALDEAAARGKVVVLAGRQGRFSAGFDLSVMGQGGDAMANLVRGGAQLSQRLLTFETPVIAAVTGHALAMGALLLLSTDYRVGMSGGFKIGLNEVAIGMTLPYFGVALARGRLHSAHLDRAVGCAEIYGPEGAQQAGYLDEVAAAEQLAARATEVATGYAQLNMAAHAATKARVREPLLNELQAALARESGGF